jgi:hypothetical protein
MEGKAAAMASLFKNLGLLVATALAIQPGLAQAVRDAKEAKEVRSESTRTGKERLGSKASDEQRVDDCKVPIEQRGPKPRPDTCGESVSSASSH